MTKICDQLSKVPNYSSEEILCCDSEDVNNGSGCKVAYSGNCLSSASRLTQCRKIGDLGEACKDRDYKDGDRESADNTCKDDNKWLCLSTNDIRNSDRNPDLDGQRNWVISGRLLSNNTADSRDSLVDSNISCGACCNNTTCVHMSNGNYENSCLNADGFKKYCPNSKGNFTIARVKCPDLFKLNNQTCQVVPFSSDNPLIRTIDYQADLCDDFTIKNPGLTPDGIAGLVVGILSIILAIIAMIKRKWLLKQWRNFRDKKMCF